MRYLTIFTMRHIKYLLFLFSGLVNASAQDIQKVLSISGNIAWTNPGQTQTFDIVPDLNQTYYDLSKTSLVSVFEGFIGLQTALNANLDGQLGVVIVGAPEVYLNGNIEQEANPDFNNYNYSYKIQHTHVAAQAKLFYNSSLPLSPYIMASLGAGNNKSYDYYQSSKLFEVFDQRLFNNDKTISFVYTLGAGFQSKLYQYIFFNIGYEFSDWGKSRVAPGYEQDNQNSIKLSHFYANQLQFGLSLII